MKFYFAFLCVVVVLFSSCQKEDNDSLPIEQPAKDIQSVILTGFWQLDKSKDAQETTYRLPDYYTVYRYLNTNEFDVYYSKTDKYATKWYKIVSLNAKVVMILYSSASDYKSNNYSETNMFDVELVDGNLHLTNRLHKNTLVYKQYSTLNNTKDLPSPL